MQLTPAQREEIRQQIEELQLWFARKPYGFTERCSAEQLRQYEDRSAELDRLIDRLN